MKKTLLQFVILLCSAFLLSSTAQASHLDGGEINYAPINDSVYRVIYKYYRNCSGGAEPDSFMLCVTNPCNTASSFTGLLVKATPVAQNGIEIPYLCAGTLSSCQGGPSTNFGWREWYYEAIVRLPSKCANWTFSVTLGARSPSDNISGSGNLYVEAKLDNLNFTRNTSPSFTNSPDPISCALNTPYVYNYNGMDKNGDSLVYSLIGARTASNCGFSSNMQYYGTNTPQNPIPNSSFSLNASTGQLNLNATMLGAFVVVVKCTEYRNGQEIGSIMRDVVYRIANCNAAKPTVALDATSLVNSLYANKLIVAYADSTFSFCFNGSSARPTASLVLNTDLATAAPGATISYTGLNTTTARGCVTWRPTMADTGYRVLRVTVIDSNCGAANISYPINTLIPMQILPARPVSVSTVLGNGKALVYPNPSNGLVQVDVATKSVVTITTLDGRKVGLYTIAEKETIDLSALAGGLYLLKIQDAQSGEVILSEKLVLRK